MTNLQEQHWEKLFGNLTTNEYKRITEKSDNYGAFAMFISEVFHRED